MATEQERNRGMGAFSTPGVDPKVVEKEFQPITSQPGVTFRRIDVEPPSSLYVRPVDALVVTVRNSDPNETLGNVAYRLMRASDGVVILNFSQFPVTSNRAATQITIPLIEGYLLSATVGGNAATKRGRYFTGLTFIQGSPNFPINSLQLISDYASTGHSPSWPTGEFISSIEGPGFKSSVQVGNPAAGADWSQTVPTGARWRVESVIATLVTSAAVANRIPTLVVDDGVNILWQFDPVAAQAASTTKVYSWAEGTTPSTGAGQTITGPLPQPLIMLAGWRIRTVTTAIQAADQYSAISLNVEEWIEQ